MPYVKEWLLHGHPMAGNKEAYLFAALDKARGKGLGTNNLHTAYTITLRKEYFPSLLSNENIPLEDRKKLKTMLEERKWNPYTIRHSSLTMKAKERLISDQMLRQHAGWTKESNMPTVYLHNFGNESVDELLRSQGYLPPRDNELFDFNPLGIKKCGNCGTNNLPEAISCSKCKLLIDSVAYQHILKEQEEKDNELKTIKDQQAVMNDMLTKLVTSLSSATDQNQLNTLAKSLAASGILKPKTSDEDKDKVEQL